MLEQKLLNVKQHIGSTVDRERDFDHRNRKMEAEMVELEERLRRAEAELAASDVMRGEMRGDKERVRVEQHRSDLEMVGTKLSE